MVRPCVLDRVVSADTCTSGISRWSEPMVLRSASCASPPSLVGRTIDGLTDDSVAEVSVIRDNSSSQVVGNALTDVKHSVDLRVCILSHDLERSEQLCSDQLALALLAEVLKWHIDSSWLPSAVALGDRVALERSASENDLSAVEFQNGIEVGFDLLVVPGQDWANREVLKASSCCLLLHLLEKPSASPVSVHEHDRLG